MKKKKKKIIVEGQLNRLNSEGMITDRRRCTEGQ
jgi:hypothetical protein